MKPAFTISLALAVATYGGFYLGHNTSVPVTEEPKQSPHAVFVEVCGVLEYVLITSDPPLGLNRRDEAIPDDFRQALQNVPKERVIILKHWDQFCPKPSTRS